MISGPQPVIDSAALAGPVGELFRQQQQIGVDESFAEPAPELASAEFAAEMAEVYAMALCRDVPFDSIASASGNASGGLTLHGIVDALENIPFLNGDITDNLSAAARRRYETRGTITGGNAIFRGSTPGSKHGHWTSQFLLIGNSNDAAAGKYVNLDGTDAPNNSAQPAFRGTRTEVGYNDGFVFFGTQIIDQRSIVARPGVDYLTNWAAWLDSQNGVDGNNFDIFLGRRRYLWTPRDFERLSAEAPLIIGGKSMGGRVASMVADEMFAAGKAVGLLCLGYPFHPPGKPAQPRTGHLIDLKTPTLICQGTRDPFGTREEVSSYELSDRIESLWLEDGDHDLKPRKRVSGITAAEHLRTLAADVRAWADRIV